MLTWYRVTGIQDGRTLWLTLPGGFRDVYLATDLPENAARWLDRAEAKRRASMENRSGVWRGITWEVQS